MGNVLRQDQLGERLLRHRGTALLFHQRFPRLAFGPLAAVVVVGPAHLAVPTAEVEAQQLLRGFDLFCGHNFRKHQEQRQRNPAEITQAHPLAAAVVLAVQVCLAKAATAAMVEPMALTQPAMEPGVVVAVAEQMEGTDLMDICGLLTGALTDGNF